jgi:uncharacterized protein YigE (DUF2233 family)
MHLLLFLLTLATAAWNEPLGGVQTRTLAHASGNIELLRFDLERYRADVLVPSQPQRAQDVRAAQGAVAVVNGGFFDTNWHSLGLRISDGVVVRDLRARVDWGVLLVRGKRAEIVHSRSYRPDPAITAAIQVGPRILVAGATLPLKPQVARRTAVALDKDGRTLTLVVTTGALDARELATLLAEQGFASALMLDGGPSTQLSAHLGKLDREMPGAYAVPDLLMLRAR